MLYGATDFLQELKKDIANIEIQQGFKTVYGSTIGSLSKGTNRDDSDYDVRMLFIWKEGGILPECEYHTEDRIRYRQFFPNKLYDCIAFWEISAFINFLCEPYIDTGYKYKLIRIVLWSFFSDYSEDPYNIQNVVQMTLKKCVNLLLERDYHQDLLLENLNMIYDRPDKKYYLNILHAYLSLCWIDERDELPPLHLNKLLKISNNSVYECVEAVKSDYLPVKLPEEIINYRKKEIAREQLVKDADKNRKLVRELIQDVNKKLHINE